MADGGKDQSQSPAKARPVKERFDNAVKVIRSLPQEGPFQPSNETKLRFYALYKQAKEGPCNIQKPSFWDVTGRAKWEAWNVCGKMSADMAMQLYVEELQQMVETMPHTKEVEDFLSSIGPFYEIAYEEERATFTPSDVMDKAANDQSSRIQSHDPNMSADLDIINTGEDGSGDESDSSEESFQESFQDIPNEASSGTIAQSQPAQTERDDHTEREDQTDGGTTNRPQTSQTRLTNQTGRSSSSAVAVTHVHHHGHQQRSVTVSAGNEGESRTAPRGSQGQGQDQRSTTTEIGGGSGSSPGVVQVGSLQSLPLAMETVTSQLSSLQQNAQSMLQQLNTLALAVHSLSQFYRQGEGGQSSAAPPVHLARHPQMGPQLVVRTGRLLTLLLKVGPIVILWPLAVNVVLSILTKRYSVNGGLPVWAWTVLTLINAIFSIALVYNR